jgi:hypothetical protein
MYHRLGLATRCCIEIGNDLAGTQSFIRESNDIWVRGGPWHTKVFVQWRRSGGPRSSCL